MKGSFPTSLIRPDLRNFGGYSSARTSHSGTPAKIWLNANEAASASAIDPHGSQRRYPQPQPDDLIAALARAYDVDPASVVTGRGSDEIIDILLRTVCSPGQGGIVITSPTFGMYEVSARLHGVAVYDVPQIDHGVRWSVDVALVAQRVRDTAATAVFIASPGNPTGAVVPRADLLWLADELANTALVVVDEAYQEFSEEPSVADQVGLVPNLVVLRTMSKAHGLAGARVGTGLVHPDLATVLRRVQAPYPVPEPVRAVAVAALGEEAQEATARRVAETIALRTRLDQALKSHPLVSATYEGGANFVLARATDVDAFLQQLADHGIVVRDMRHLPGLGDAVRVTVGTTADLAAIELSFARGLGHPAPDATSTSKQRKS